MFMQYLQNECDFLFRSACAPSSFLKSAYCIMMKIYYPGLRFHSIYIPDAVAIVAIHLCRDPHTHNHSYKSQVMETERTKNLTFFKTSLKQLICNISMLGWIL